MSLKLDADTMNRLYTHLAYTQTIEPNETIEKQSETSANNCFLGTSDLLSKYAVFKDLTTSQSFRNEYFDDNGNPIKLPPFENNQQLVAFVGSKPHQNVYGIYSLKAMKDIIYKCVESRDICQWKFINIKDDIRVKIYFTISQVLNDRKLLLLPTPPFDYKQLNDDEKAVIQYKNFKAQRIRVTQKAAQEEMCAIS